MKTIAITIVAFLIMYSAYSQTQAELNNKAKVEYEKVDKQLNQIYQRILQEYKNDSIFTKSMKEAQRQWVKFRDAQIKMKYPPYPNSDESVLMMCRYYYLKELTEDRRKVLTQWLDSEEEGDVCSGSKK